MNVHKNARTTPQSRALLVHRILREHWPVSAVAIAFGISERTVYKWLARYRAQGAAGLLDRSSAARRRVHALRPAWLALIRLLRHAKLVAAEIAARLPVARSTVSSVLHRLGLGRLRYLNPKPPVIRYERERPGELIHLDTKKLGKIDGIGHRITGHRTGMTKNRGIGWDHLHVAIDDASRLAYTEILPDDRKESATAFLARSLAFFGQHGVTVERVMTDNGSAYRSREFAVAIGAAGLKHIRTRPYTPRTNGKAERFIQSSLREWAYAVPYLNSAHRRRRPGYLAALLQRGTTPC